MSSVKTLIENLENRTYLTMRARTETANKFKRWDSFIHYVNTYFSLVVVIYSIWNINNGVGRIALALMIFSVIDFAFSIFVNALNLNEKHLHYKDNYIQLNALYSRVKYLNSSSRDDLDVVKEEYMEMEKEYNQILKSCENHSTFDFYVSVLDNKQYLDSISKFKQIKIYILAYSYIVLEIILKVFFFVVPFLLPQFIKLIDMLTESMC